MTDLRGNYIRRVAGRFHANRKKRNSSTPCRNASTQSACQNPLRFQPSKCLSRNARKSLFSLVRNICLLNARASDSFVWLKQNRDITLTTLPVLLRIVLH